MVTQLKNVLVVDGTGWFPYWGDILIEDDTIKDIISGENIIIREEKNFDRTVNFKRGEKPGAYAFVAVGDGPFTKADYEKLVDDIMKDMGTGMKLGKAYRKQTGYGLGQREYMVAGMKANLIVLDKETKKIAMSFADGKEL